MSTEDISCKKTREYPFQVIMAADTDTSTEKRGGGVCWRYVKKEYIRKYAITGNYFKTYTGLRNYANSKLFLPYALQNAEEVLLTFEQDLDNAYVQFYMDKAVVSYPRLIKELINLAMTIECRQNCKIEFRLISKSSDNQALLAATLMSRNDESEAKAIMASFTNSPYRI